MGTQEGRHLRINIPANLPLHLPFIKAPLKPRVNVGVRGELGAAPWRDLAATPQAPWAPASSCGSWDTQGSGGGTGEPPSSQLPGEVWLLNPIIFAD